MVFTVLTPPENGAGEFPDRKNSLHFPQKIEFPEWYNFKKIMYTVYMYM